MNDLPQPPIRPDHSEFWRKCQESAELSAKAKLLEIQVKVELKYVNEDLNRYHAAYTDYVKAMRERGKIVFADGHVEDTKPIPWYDFDGKLIARIMPDGSTEWLERS